jgi:hypothetical protein
MVIVACRFQRRLINRVRRCSAGQGPEASATGGNSISF